MHANPLRLVAAASALSCLATIAAAQQMPRGSFLIGPVESRYQLVQQVQVDPVVSERYQRHFGMTHEEVVRYFSTLRTTTLPETSTYRVWYTREGTEVQEMRYLNIRRGERVFVDQENTVVLRLKCGNPMVDRTIARTYYDTVVRVQEPVVVERTVVTTTTERAQPITTRLVVSPVGPFVTRHSLTWEDAAAAVVLAEATGLAPDAIVAMRGPDLVSTSLVDLAPALLMAWHAQRPLTDVFGMYTGGSTWLDLASQFALPTTYWNTSGLSPMGWSNADFTNNMWQNLLFNTLFVPSSEFSYFMGQNIPIEQLLVASVIGRQFNIPAREALTAYHAANNNWLTVENNWLATPPIPLRFRN